MHRPIHVYIFSKETGMSNETRVPTKYKEFIYIYKFHSSNILKSSLSRTTRFVSVIFILKQKY